MGLTPIRTGVFYAVSQIGMLAGTAVYVNAGTQLAQIDSLSGILSPDLVFSFALLGIFPLIAKKTAAKIKSRKALAATPRPKKFDYNLVVIGAGAAGLVTAYIAATVRAKVALIEKHKMGGDCLNTGCVPSKALIRSAKMLSYARRAKEFGFDSGNIEFDFSRVMERVHQVIAKIAPHDSVERYTQLGWNASLEKQKLRPVYGGSQRQAPDHEKNCDRKRCPALCAAHSRSGSSALSHIGYGLETQSPARAAGSYGRRPHRCELTQTFCRLGRRSPRWR